VTLLLCGIALAPLSILLGLVISRPDALVVAVPSFVFVSMLPGLLYPDLGPHIAMHTQTQYQCMLSKRTPNR
jgi:hypothetical protein